MCFVFCCEYRYDDCDHKEMRRMRLKCPYVDESYGALCNEPTNLGTDMVRVIIPCGPCRQTRFCFGDRQQCWV